MLDFESIIQIPTPLERLEEELFAERGVEVFVKRDDLTHPFLSGNKFRKLKYPLLEAWEKGARRLLTFGGAYSNHLSAFAFACREFGFEGKVLVRGDELTENSSPTLAFAREMGVELAFVSREAYRDKARLAATLGPGYFVIPEGGSHALAIRGVAEIMQETGALDYLLTPCGTGGTLAGLLAGAPESAEIIGVSALKNGGFLREEVSRFLSRPFPANARLETEFHFGGYARYTRELLDFIRNFEARHRIRLEQVYTGKTFYAFYRLLEAGHFQRGSRVILLHTGGLQGRLPELDRA